MEQLAIQDECNENEMGQLFSPKRKKLCFSGKKQKCVVLSCQHTSNDRDVVFHKFPHTNLDRCRNWMAALNQGQVNFKSSFVCSKHFQNNDYHPCSGQVVHAFYGVRQHRLRAEAVPSLNLSKIKIMMTSLKRPLGERSQLLPTNTSDSVERSSVIPDLTTAADSESSVSINKNSGRTKAAKNCTFYKMGNLDRNIKQSVSVGIQCDSNDVVITTTENSKFLESIGDANTSTAKVDLTTPPISTNLTEQETIETNRTASKSFSFTDFVYSDTKLYQLTGVASFALFNMLVVIFKEKKGEVRKNSLTHKAQLLLTFMKLRLNLSFTFLSILFCVSKPTSKAVFVDTIQHLDMMLDDSLSWPSLDEVRKNTPHCFQNFKNVRVVLDCTEIKTHKPKCCLICRMKLYSWYKGCHTLKYLVGVSPAGLYTFISKGFGGRSSDKAIFEDSRLIEKLEPHVDSIMVDKGFLIKNICDKYNIGLIHPAFLTRNRPQFDKEEAVSNVKVSSARVHVERAIGKAKNYKIISDVMPWNIANLADSIMKVICAMVNLSRPILADDKFPMNNADSD